ncbi:MAG: WGR domain-containing protein [Sedimenticola sp.]
MSSRLRYAYPMNQLWHKETRYYQVRLEQDLFGFWVVTRVWGRRGTRRGQIRTEKVSSPAQGLLLLEEIGAVRTQHGYTRVQ